MRRVQRWRFYCEYWQDYPSMGVHAEPDVVAATEAEESNNANRERWNRRHASPVPPTAVFAASYADMQAENKRLAGEVVNLEQCIELSDAFSDISAECAARAAGKALARALKATVKLPDAVVAQVIAETAKEFPDLWVLERAALSKHSEEKPDA